MSLAQAALLGLIQGVAEWLPVSSEGVVTAAHALAFGGKLTDAVAFSLWLHLGTMLSVLAALKTEAYDIVRSTLRRPRCPSPILTFLVIATLTSGPIGLLLLVGLEEFSQRIGAIAMVVIGIMMTVTGALLLQNPRAGLRTRNDLTWLDAVLTGVAQGIAALPGLSRSGLTMSALLSRGIDRREGLTISFLLSVPASLGAGVYAAIDTGAYASPEAVVALGVAAVSGFVTIRALLKLAERINFGWFAVIVGIVIISGAVWQLLV